MNDMSMGVMKSHHRHETMRHHGRPDGPGKSEGSVGWRARGMVSQARDGGIELPRNAGGFAASTMAKCCCACDMESMFSAWLHNELEEIGLLPDGGAVEAEATEIAEGVETEAAESAGETDDATEVSDEADAGDTSGEGDGEGDDGGDSVADGGEFAAGEGEADGDEGAGEDGGLGEDLTQLAEAARQVYDLTNSILEQFDLNSLETALELLTADEDEAA